MFYKKYSYLALRITLFFCFFQNNKLPAMETYLGYIHKDNIDIKNCTDQNLWISIKTGGEFERMDNNKITRIKDGIRIYHKTFKAKEIYLIKKNLYNHTTLRIWNYNPTFSNAEDYERNKLKSIIGVYFGPIDLAGLESIKIIKDGSKVKLNYNFTGKECSICLERFIEDGRVTILQCGHFFHEECTQKWENKFHEECIQNKKDKQNTKCPICDQEIKIKKTKNAISEEFRSENPRRNTT